VALERSSAILEIELNSADVLDFKAIGLGAADLASVGVLVAAHRSIPFWWASTGLLILSSLFFTVVLRPRRWEFGPDFNEFRELHYGKSRLEITEAMLSEVLHALDTNSPFLKAKGRHFKRGFAILLVALLILAASGIRAIS
jgi:hypothetical protein